VQVVGTGAQEATVLEAEPSPSSSSQVTTGVTQIQIGCIVECFGTTTTDASSAAVIQQFLTNLNALQPACGTSNPQPTPATEQSVIDLVACQVQAAQGVAAQTQVASQTATTVQVTDTTTVSEPPAPSSVAQAQQGTWQLQIGCVFYCVDTQQVQQARQSITIIQIQTGPSGSNPGEVSITDQIIWQVQVGCVAWCYDATQVQVVDGQSTLIVDESPPSASVPPPPGSSPPPGSPTPPSSPPPAPAPGPAPEPASPAPGQSTASKSASPSTETMPRRLNSPAPQVALLSALAETGSSMVAVTAPVAARVPTGRGATEAFVSAETWGTPTVAVHLSIAAARHVNERRPQHSSVRPNADRSVRVADAVVAAPGAPSDAPAVALLLAAAAALLALAVFWTQIRDKSER
jgi:hypothetical protein